MSNDFSGDREYTSIWNSMKFILNNKAIKYNNSI